LLFLHNFFRSIRKGAPAEPNPWNAATLEWQPEPADVHRWPYDYSLPGAENDCTPQTEP
jgi:cytochrome c oxidase subunit 1